MQPMITILMFRSRNVVILDWFDDSYLNLPVVNLGFDSVGGN